MLKHLPFVCLLTMLAWLSACAGPSAGVDGSSTPESPTQVFGELETLLVRQFEGAAPGAEMAALRSLVGSWSATMTLLAWPTDEVELPATVASGETHIRTALGERFLEWDTQLHWSGTEIASRACLGYDKQSERYQLWRASELGSGQAVYAGSGDARRGGLYLDRTQTDDGQVSRLRTVLRQEGDDRFELEEFGYDSTRGEWLAVRITRYVRLADR